MSNTLITEEQQYLTFNLADEMFGIEVVQVREILDVIKVTKVPQTPEFMCGVINLRGNVVPVVDMRLKFGMTKTEKTVDTCIVVMEINVDSETTILGVLVDSVEEVIELEQRDIEPAPKIGTRLRIEFIKGMGKKDDKFIIILNIDKIFSSDELLMLNKSEKNVEEKEAV